jgi:tetratricopeptide (TPR) repeat protein
MKNRKREARKGGAAPPAVPAARPGFVPQGRYLVLAALAAAVVVLWAYGPSMNGPFLFDDNFLPFAVSSAGAQPLAAWLHGPRPLLMATYWMSARLAPAPDDTWWYHFPNVAIHCMATGLVFFIVRRLLEWSHVAESRRGLLAGLAAALFLLHPAQSEAVAYVAGRSDGFSVMLALAAFAVFLYRRESAADWRTALAVLLLFGAALAAKEHTIALPALLLLTDYWWNPGFSLQGIRRNWKIYTSMAAACVGGVAYFWPLITHATTAGFGFKEFTWYQYFFTECRAIFVYIGLFLFPANLTLDWDFPISHTILEHRAIVGLAVLVTLAAAAWLLRRRFPLASYGFFVFLLLMAPTSSILPIQDPVAERRLYFGMLGLLLILVDVLARVKLEPKALTAGGLAVLLLAAVVTHARAEVWADPVTLWQDTVRKSPGKWRPHFQLGFAYYSAAQQDLASGYPGLSAQRCGLAVQEYQKTAALHPADADVLLDWGLAYDCLNQPEKAVYKLEESAVKHPTAHVFSQIGMVYGKLEKWPDALLALAAAEKLDPGFPETYLYRGKVYIKTNQWLNAYQEYRRALELDPGNADARHDMQVVVNQLRAHPGK